MNLPPPCSECADSDWVVVERGGVSGAGRCSCARGLELAKQDKARELAQDAARQGRFHFRGDVPGIDEVAALAAVERLSITMRMVPSGDAAHMLIAEELQKFVCDPTSLGWLLDAAPVVFRGEWPTISELRALYCRCNVPRDGQHIESGIFTPENWPVLPGVALPKQIEAPPSRGVLVSGDQEMYEAVEVLAGVKAMPGAPPKITPPNCMIPLEQR